MTIIKQTTKPKFKQITKEKTKRMQPKFIFIVWTSKFIFIL